MGGDPTRIDEIKSRYPQLFSGRTDQVEQFDEVEPLLDADLDGVSTDNQPYDSGESSNNGESSELNLNDFTLDPDWDLIEGLTPGPARKDAADQEQADDTAEDEMLRDGLRDFPEVEELDDDEDLFPRKQDDRQR